MHSKTSSRIPGRDGQARRRISSFLVRGEEPFGDRVTGAVAFGAPRDRDPVLAGGRAEVQANGPAALIGIVNETRLGAAAGERYLQRVDDECGADVIGHRPADDAAAIAVVHGGEIDPALPAAQIGDFGEPEHVRAGRAEPATRSSATRGQAWTLCARRASQASGLGCPRNQGNSVVGVVVALISARVPVESRGTAGPVS
jgi:hypothetical protein